MSHTQSQPLKRVLALSMQDARVPAPGGETRSYFFLKSLASKTRLSVVCLSGGLRFSSELASECEQVICPKLPTLENSNPKADSNFRKKTKFAKALCFPWLNQWYDFQNYFVQYGLPSATEQSSSLKHRLLRVWTRGWYRLATNFCSIDPFTTLIYERNFRSCLPEIIAAHQRKPFDYLWCEHSITYPYIKRLQRLLGPLPVLCNSHNVETLLQRRLSENSGDPWTGEFQRIQTRLFTRIESECYSKSKLVYTCSKDDAEHASALAPQGKFLVVGNGVDTEYFRPNPTALRNTSPSLLFTGGYGYKPNRDAVRYFVKDILPLIWNEVPNCEFTFAGANASDLFKELQPLDSRVRCVCSPADIRPLFDQTWVYVVPLQSGGGTRLKVLEAMAMEKPIVSTAVGAEGIPCTPDEHIVFADSPATFARATSSLLCDKNQQQRLGTNASLWVRKTFDWAILQKSIDAGLDSYIT